MVNFFILFVSIVEKLREGILRKALCFIPHIGLIVRCYVFVFNHFVTNYA